MKSGFECKKERYKHRQKIFAPFEFDFFRVLLKFAIKIRLLIFKFKSHFRLQMSKHVYSSFSVLLLNTFLYLIDWRYLLLH